MPPRTLPRLLLAGLLAGLASSPAPALATHGRAAGPTPPGTQARSAPLSGAFLRPIMTEDEAKEWAGLASEAAREAFVREFWLRRDPTPGTEPNELRDILERRVRRADRLFGEDGVAGRATDRGRVLLLLGLPDEIATRPADDGDAGPTEVWTYSRPPFQGQLRFALREGGRVLVDPPALPAATFLASTREELRLVLGESFGAATEGTPAPAGVALPPGDPGTVAAAVPPEVRIWMQLVQGGRSRAELELESDLTTFPATEGTYATLAFLLDREDLVYQETLTPLPPEGAAAGAGQAGGAAAAGAGEAAGEREQAEEATAAAAEVAAAVQDAAEVAADLQPKKVYARIVVFGAFLQGERGHESTVHQFVVPVSIGADEGGPVHTPLLSLGVTLAPGSYRLAWGVLDQATQKAVTRDAAVEIPDYSQGGLQTSEPLVARPPHQGATEPMSTQQVYRGVRLGNVLIDDVLDRTFARDDVIEIVTMVTGWQANPNDPGKPLLEVEYRVLEDERNASIARLPAQSLTFHVLGQQIPLAQVRALEAGSRYRIHVRIKDMIGGQEITRIVPIAIAAPAQEPELPRQ